MLGKYALVAFVSTAEPVKARTFYEETLGLPVEAVDDYGVMYQVWAAPGGTKVAWFKDPGGNLLSLSEIAF